MKWFVVLNADGEVLAVYGAALPGDAVAKARSITQETGCATYVQDIRGERPHVGDKIALNLEKV